MTTPVNTDLESYTKATAEYGIYLSLDNSTRGLQVFFECLISQEMISIVLERIMLGLESLQSHSAARNVILKHLRNSAYQTDHLYVT